MTDKTPERGEAFIMLDLETMSSRNNGAIVSIGAFKFGSEELQEPGDVREDQKFYAAVTLKSAVDAGLHIDPDTVMWWMSQTDAAREALKAGGDLRQALISFATFVPKNAVVWGYGSTFDNVLLRNAYQAVGMECPWKYRNDLCYRTMVRMFPDVARVDYGEKHNALDDAIAQGLTLQRMLAKLRVAV